jgi:hypothetical protein
MGMEALKIDEPASHPFNSPLETGIRALVLLEAFYPRQCDLIEMTWLDHLVVHTADLDGDDVPRAFIQTYQIELANCSFVVDYWSEA